MWMGSSVPHRTVPARSGRWAVVVEERGGERREQEGGRTNPMIGPFQVLCVLLMGNSDLPLIRVVLRKEGMWV